MFNVKKTMLMILALGHSTLFAGTMGPSCSLGNVTVPCQQRGWDVGAKALYLQPSLGPLNFPVWQLVNGVEEFRNDGSPWNWGFMVEGSYHFATGTDLNLNWYHTNGSHSIIIDGAFSSATAAYSGVGPDNTTTKSTWDAVNLELGQRVNYTQAFNVRYHGGVEFVRVDYKRTAVNFPPAPLLTSAARTITYNGFGPRTGVDASYTLVNGLSLNANTAVGLYAGSSKFHSVASATGGRAGSSMIIAPELEAKLGATYTCAFAQGDISLDAGWMWINYFGPMNYADDSQVHSANFGQQGPFLGLKWLGNIA